MSLTHSLIKETRTFGCIIVALSTAYFLLFAMLQLGNWMRLHGTRGFHGLDGWNNTLDLQDLKSRTEV